MTGNIYDTRGELDFASPEDPLNIQRTPSNNW